MPVGGKPPRHAGEKSRRTIRQERYVKELGEFPKEGKDWTIKELNLLVTFYLSGVAELTIAKELGRTWKSIDTFRWKMVDRSYLGGYVPECMEDREFKNYNQRELWFIRMAMDKGWTANDIARATGRSMSAVKSKVESLQRARRVPLF